MLVLDAAGDEITLYHESHALPIGVSDYTGGWPDLPGIREDLRVVGRALQRQGFQVEVLEDPSQARLEAAFRDFILRHGRKRDNRLLFYFAGHGHTDKPAWTALNALGWDAGPADGAFGPRTSSASWTPPSVRALGGVTCSPK